MVRRLQPWGCQWSECRTDNWFQHFTVHAGTEEPAIKGTVGQITERAAIHRKKETFVDYGPVNCRPVPAAAATSRRACRGKDCLTII